MSIAALPDSRGWRSSLVAALRRGGITLAVPAILAAVLWCGFYAAIAGYVGDNDALFIDTTAFQYAADVAFNWNWSPYDAGMFWAWRYDLGLKLFPFLYPPAALLVFAPLAMVSIVESVILLTVANFVAVAVTVGVLYRRYVKPLPDGSWTWIALAVLCLHYGFVRTMMNGQINLQVLLLLLLAWGTAGQRRWALVTGVALAAAILLKTYPAVLLGVFLLRRDWRVIGICLASLAAACLWSLAVLPPDAWSDWLRDVAPTGRWGAIPFQLFSPSSHANISLNGLLSRLLDPQLVGSLGLPLTAAVLGTTFATFWHLRALPSRAFYDWAFPLTLAATFLIAPLSWFHHTVFLLPALLVLLAEAAKRPKPESRILLAIVLFNSVYWQPIGRLAELLSTLPALGAIALWVALIALATQDAQTRSARMPDLRQPDPA